MVRTHPLARLADLSRRHHLGHPAIDAQHRELFRIALGIDAGVEPGRVLDDLLAYAAYHVSYEEQLATASGTLTPAHAVGHQHLLVDIGFLQQDGINRHLRSRHLLSRRVLNHIDRDDRALVRALRHHAAPLGDQAP